MVSLKKLLKEKSVQILLIAAIIKISLLIILIRESFIMDIDFILSLLLFMAIIILESHYLLHKPNLKTLFVVGVLTVVSYNGVLILLNLIPSMSLYDLILSGVDMGIIAVCIGYLRGVK